MYLQNVKFWNGIIFAPQIFLLKLKTLKTNLDVELTCRLSNSCQNLNQKEVGQLMNIPEIAMYPLINIDNAYDMRNAQSNRPNSSLLLEFSKGAHALHVLLGSGYFVQFGESSPFTTLIGLLAAW